MDNIDAELEYLRRRIELSDDDEETSSLLRRYNTLLVRADQVDDKLLEEELMKLRAAPEAPRELYPLFFYVFSGQDRARFFKLRNHLLEVVKSKSLNRETFDFFAHIAKNAPTLSNRKEAIKKIEFFRHYDDKTYYSRHPFPEEAIKALVSILEEDWENWNDRYYGQWKDQELISIAMDTLSNFFHEADIEKKVSRKTVERIETVFKRLINFNLENPEIWKKTGRHMARSLMLISGPGGGGISTKIELDLKEEMIKVLLEDRFHENMRWTAIAYFRDPNVAIDSNVVAALEQAAAVDNKNEHIRKNAQRLLSLITYLKTTST